MKNKNFTTYFSHLYQKFNPLVCTDGTDIYNTLKKNISYIERDTLSMVLEKLILSTTKQPKIG